MIICLPPPGPIFFSRLLFAKRCAPPLALRRAVSAIIVPHASLLKRRLLKCRLPGRVDGVVCCVRTDHRFSVKSRGEHLDVGVLARSRSPGARRRRCPLFSANQGRLLTSLSRCGGLMEEVISGVVPRTQFHSSLFLLFSTCFHLYIWIAPGSPLARPGQLRGGSYSPQRSHHCHQFIMWKSAGELHRYIARLC